MMGIDHLEERLLIDIGKSAILSVYEDEKATIPATRY
jgi:hypothetical protein